MQVPFQCTGGFSSKVADEMTTEIRFVARAVSAQVALSQVSHNQPPHAARFEKERVTDRWGTRKMAKEVERNDADGGSGRYNVESVIFWFDD